MTELGYEGRDRRKDDGRRYTDAMCNDHEARIRLLEALCDQLSERMDRTDATLHSIDLAVRSLTDEMESHIQIMRQHIDHSFAVHERNEMSMHKDMLVKAIQMMVGGVTALMTAIGVMGWWIFQHLVGIA